MTIVIINFYTRVKKGRVTIPHPKNDINAKTAKQNFVYTNDNFCNKHKVL